MLLLLAAQVGSGLLADDDLGFTGPLAGAVSNAAVKTATRYHRGFGQWLLIALVALHVLSIVFYLVRGKNLLWPMFRGDKQLPPDEAAQVQPSTDGAGNRILALIVLALAAAAVWWLVTSAPPPSMGF
jgi:cytochrome b